MHAVHDTVRAAVLHRLDLLDRAADGWRLLLTVHRRDEDGRCRACPTGTRGRWPCQIWRMAHQQLIGEGLPHRQRTRPLRNPLGRITRTIAARRAAGLLGTDGSPASRRTPPESPAEITTRIPRVRLPLPAPRQRSHR